MIQNNDISNTKMYFWSNNIQRFYVVVNTCRKTGDYLHDLPCIPLKISSEVQDKLFEKFLPQNYLMKYLDKSKE